MDESNMNGPISLTGSPILNLFSFVSLCFLPGCNSEVVEYVMRLRGSFLGCLFHPGNVSFCEKQTGASQVSALYAYIHWVLDRFLRY